MTNRYLKVEDRSCQFDRRPFFYLIVYEDDEDGYPLAQFQDERMARLFTETYNNSIRRGLEEIPKMLKEYIANENTEEEEDSSLRHRD